MKLNGEDDVKREIKKILKRHKIWYYMPQAGKFGTVGIPDFICCKNGRLIGIEAKFAKNKPTDIQYARLKEIRDAGGIGIWINDERLQMLDDLLEKMV